MSVQSTPPVLSADGDVAVCRTILYEALSLGFYHPAAHTLETLTSPGRRHVLEASSFLDASDASIDWDNRDSFEESGVVDLSGRAAAWAKASSDLSLESLQRLHGLLFGHTARGLVCPYETEYGQTEVFQQTQQLSDLRGFYSVFGLQPRTDERERPDHISCELEFSAFLSRKEAFALKAKNASMLQATTRATKLFLREHLGRFGRALACQVEKHDPDGFLGKTAALLSEFLRFECRRVGVQIGTPHLSLRASEEEQVPMACSTGDDLVPLEG